MEHIYLQGSEDVRRAAQSISSAADQMCQAGNFLQEALLHHQRFMDEWLDRLEGLLKRQAQEEDDARQN